MNSTRRILGELLEIVLVALSLFMLGALWAVSHAQAAPELPRVTVSTTMPATTRTLSVSATGNLQAALDSAKAGDAIELARGTTYIGNFVLRARSTGTGWVVVRPAAPVGPEAVSTRMTPSLAAAARLPTIATPNAAPAIQTAPGARGYRFVSVEITATPANTLAYAIIALGDGGSDQNTLASVPSDLVFDRVYVHGTPVLDSRRCFALNSGATAIIDSYVSECHSAFDAQAIAGWNGPGPFTITNNYLEAAAENIAFGGAPVFVPDIVPSDITIVRNHIAKPLAWKGRWLIKNLIEFKAGRRVLIESNVMENSWPDGQAGFAFVLWTVDQGGQCPWCVTEDVTIRNNLIRNVASGYQLTARGGTTGIGMRRVAIANNLVVGLNPERLAGFGRVFQISDSIADLAITHNTVFSTTNSSILWGGESRLPGHVVRDNLMGGGAYQLFSSRGQGKAAWDFYGGGDTSAFRGNVIALFPAWLGPAGNRYPENMDAIGLVGNAVAAYSATVPMTDLALSSTSQYRGTATDGRDPGVDVPALTAAIAGVTVGSPVGPPPTPSPTPTPPEPTPVPTPTPTPVPPHPPVPPIIPAPAITTAQLRAGIAALERAVAPTGRENAATKAALKPVLDYARLLLGQVP